MDLDERFEIDAGVDQVWPLLRDPQVVASCMPGVELTEQREDGSFAGTITVTFGPTTARFAGTATIAIDDDTRTGTIEARGKDGRGSSRASASTVVRLVPSGPTSVLEVSGKIDVGGPLAQFARTGGVQITRVLLGDFAACISARARPAPTGGTGPAAPAPGPTRISAWRVLRRSVADALGRAWRRVRRAGRTT